MFGKNKKRVIICDRLNLRGNGMNYVRNSSKTAGDKQNYSVNKICCFVRE